MSIIISDLTPMLFDVLQKTTNKNILDTFFSTGNMLFRQQLQFEIKMDDIKALIYFNTFFAMNLKLLWHFTAFRRSVQLLVKLCAGGRGASPQRNGNVHQSKLPPFLCCPLSAIWNAYFKMAVSFNTGVSARHISL